MKINGYLCFFAALVIVLVLVMGCTTPQTSGTATPAPAVKTAAPTSVAGSSQNTVAQVTTAAKITDIDTIVNFHFNDISCVDVQKEMGIVYLYPDEKYKLRASSPNVAGVNVNVLFVDENDKLILGQTKPQWDSLEKVWKYPGIVPLAQFNDITVPQEKTFTIKTQSKYYICVDDRKETGINDIMLRVPVTLTKL